MENRQSEQEHPLASSTVSTTVVHGPQTTTTTTISTGGQGPVVADYGSRATTVTHPTITTTTHSPAFALSSPPSSNGLHSSSIRIRRPASRESVPDPPPAISPPAVTDSSWQAGRRRSSSEPRPPSAALIQDDGLRRQVTALHPPLQPLYEEGAKAGGLAPDHAPPSSQRPGMMRMGLNRQTSAINIRRKDHASKDSNENTMGTNVVDVLDVIGWCIRAF